MNYKQSDIKLFKGFIYHQRNGRVDHFFKNTTHAILINLKKNQNNSQLKHPTLFSIDKFNLFSWSSSIHGSQQKIISNECLYKFIISLITSSVNEEIEVDEIKLLTFPKVLGFGFNPLSIYFCYNNKGLLLHSVFEVRNTFGDIHHYILKNTQQNGDSQKTLKKLFVSPFYQKKGYYYLYSKQINRKILTSVKYIIDNNIVFSASMDLKEIEFKNLNILKGLITFSLFPGKIWINIHLQALFLWLKKVAFYKVPKSEKIKHSFGNKMSSNK